MKLPQFKVQSKKNEVRVLWKQQPRFGPYLFNGVPFFRSLRHRKALVSSSASSYECAGNYSFNKKNKSFYLEPAPGYKIKRDSIIIHPDNMIPSTNNIKNQSYFYFQMPGQIKTMKKNYKSGLRLSCSRLVNTNLVSVLLWNKKKKKWKNPLLRKAITMAVPRHSLLKNGAGSWGLFYQHQYLAFTLGIILNFCQGLLTLMLPSRFFRI